MCSVKSGATSHVPRPLTSPTIAVTASTRIAPLKAITRPMTTNGTVLAIRCPNPACRKGAATIPVSPSSSRGSMPYWSRLPPAIASTTSSPHIRATIAPTTLKPAMRVSRSARCGSATFEGVLGSRVAIQGTLHRSEIARRQVPDAAVHAGLGVALDPLRLGGRQLHRHTDLAPGLLPTATAQLLDPGDELVLVADPIGKPLIGKGEHTVTHRPAVAAEQYGGTRLLDGLGPGPDRIEVHVLAMVGRLVLGPDRSDGLHTLAQQPEPLRGMCAVVSHLLHVPAGAHAEDEAAAREPVHARRLLGRGDRVALHHQQDARAHSQPLSGRSRGHARHDRIVGPPVLLGQVAAGGVGRFATDGDVGVVGKEQ